MMMNPDMDNFMQKFFQTNRLEDADVMSMEQLVRQYPYYAPLQYILAKKYRQVDNTLYELQITKTAVFFSNPHWLNDLLLSDGIISSEDNVANVTEPVQDILPAQNEAVADGTYSEQNADEEQNIELQQNVVESESREDFELTQSNTEVEEDRFLTEKPAEEPVQDILPVQSEVVADGTYSEQNTDEEQNIELQQNIVESESRPDFELTQSKTEGEEDQFLTEKEESGSEAYIPSFNEESVARAWQAENNMESLPEPDKHKNIRELDPAQEEPDANAGIQDIPRTLSSEPFVSDNATDPVFSPTQLEFQEIIPAELQEYISQEIPESFPENMHEDEAAADAPAELLESGSDLPAHEKEHSITIGDAWPKEATSGSNPMDLQQGKEKDKFGGEQGEAPGKDNIASEKPELGLPSGNLPGKFTKPGPFSSPSSGNLPLIEPLYATDYFASQGIKLRDEDGKDKLSQKLRSFTEWLKTMKRIHPEKLEQEMDPQTSTVIQHIAEHSNELEDVVTEAMAEVYARQGLRNKAAEVYQKLSLLNPNKRAYFAARISKLNET